MNEKSIILAVVLITVSIIGGAAFLFSNSAPKFSKDTQKTQEAKIEVSHKNFDFKNISYSGGNVEHAFTIKNTGKNEVKIFNMKTSCMCTTAFFQTQKEKGPSFGMPGHINPNSSWAGTLQPGQEGSVVAVFDPTAHGPEGVGPMSRLIGFETNDPNNSYVEFSIQGTVVKD